MAELIRKTSREKPSEVTAFGGSQYVCMYCVKKTVRWSKLVLRVVRRGNGGKHKLTFPRVMLGLFSAAQKKRACMHVSCPHKSHTTKIQNPISARIVSVAALPGYLCSYLNFKLPGASYISDGRLWREISGCCVGRVSSGLPWVFQRQGPLFARALALVWAGRLGDAV